MTGKVRRHHVNTEYTLFQQLRVSCNTFDIFHLMYVQSKQTLATKQPPKVFSSKGKF